MHRGEMVGAFTKVSCSRLSHRSKYHHFVEERIGGSRISPTAALHGVPPLETFEAVDHPSEPVDMDQPARCPPPERSILRDGMIWKELLARRSEKAKAMVGAAAAAAEAECEQPAGEVPVHESRSTAGTSNSVENAGVTWMAADQLIPPCGVLNVVQGA